MRRLTMNRSAVLVLLAASLALTGCLKPPVKQIEDAKTALAAAREAGAEQIVPDQVSAAEGDLKEAETLQSKDIPKAFEKAVNAEGKANVARVDAEGKKALTEAQDEIERLKNEEAALAAKLAEMQAGLGKSRADVADAKRRLKEVQDALAAQQQLAAAKRGEIDGLKERLASASETAAAGKTTQVAAKPKAKPKAKPVEQTAAEEPASAGSQGEEHKVERGDTLWAIAGQFYGNPIHWPRIYVQNRDRIRDPHWIYPGQVFMIPAAAASAAGESRAARQNRESAELVGGVLKYTVQRGDCLWNIAERKMGSAGAWIKIYEAHKDTIKDPHWIYPGQKFTIPE